MLDSVHTFQNNINLSMFFCDILGSVRYTFSYFLSSFCTTFQGRLLLKCLSQSKEMVSKAHWKDDWKVDMNGDENQSPKWKNQVPLEGLDHLMRCPREGYWLGV